MNKMEFNLPKLTENDKIVLKKILGSKKIADSDIAKTMKLSPQAIFKIRGKLEDCGIIKGYMPIVDFKKIGINVMTLLIIRLTSKIWNRVYSRLSQIGQCKIASGNDILLPPSYVINPNH